jgi:hypothetical protein
MSICQLRAALADGGRRPMSSLPPRRRTSVQQPGRTTVVVVTADGLDVTSWPLAGADRPDLALADRLARCQLAARRLGWAIEVHGAEAPLADLLELLGWCGAVITAVVAPPAGSGALGQAEQREQGRVEEVVVADDPTV